MRLLVLAGLTGWVYGDISGFVIVSGSGMPGTPIQGARVHLQADPTIVVFSAADGSFTLPVSPVGMVTITAALPHDPANTTNYLTGGVDTVDGASGVTIELDELPVADVPFPAPSSAASCANCHPDQYFGWAFSAHAGAATDTWVRDLYSGDGTPGGANGYVFRDLHDPSDTGLCATCHAPLADMLNPGNTFLNDVTDPVALEGINCVACHKVSHVNNNVNALHHLGNATYRFPDGPAPTWRYVWGPLDDVTFTSMDASYQPQFSESIFCASCHQYTNPTTGAPGQSTYDEWLASPFAIAGPSYQTCQDCHMPTLGAGQVCVVGAPPMRTAPQNLAHGFESASASGLAAAVSLSTATSDAAGVLSVVADISNLALGHDFPTGVSVRNAFVLIEASFNGTPLVQIGGDTIPFWASDNVPGEQPGDWAGYPGAGFAKVLQGRINGIGPVVRPVLFIDAESVYSDTQIPAGGVGTANVQFEVPYAASAGDTVDVRARLYYRRAWRSVVVDKGWTQTPQGGEIELLVGEHITQHQLADDGVRPTVPTLDLMGVVMLCGLLGGLALFYRRRAA